MFKLFFNKFNSIFAVILSTVALSFSAVNADTIGYITKSATNAGWMMINQGAADAAASGKGT